MKDRTYKKILLSLMMAFVLIVGMALGVTFTLFRATAAGAEEIHGARSEIIIGEDQPGERHWGYSPPQVDGVTLEDGRLYIVYRQFPMFSYADHQPLEHVYREVYHAVGDQIELRHVEVAKVTPAYEVEERIEWGVK
jgi:hypothetical protein